MKNLRLVSMSLLLVCCSWMASAQASNQRLILKDGSYQIVHKYEVVGDRVRYISAERGGDWEELPASLVDWSATNAWAKAHAPGAPGPVVTSPIAVPAGSQDAAQIDKEAKAEHDEEVARMPTVAPGLRLPDADGVFILDTFHDQPELIEVPQNSGGLNTSTPHNVLRAAIPGGGTKQLIQLEGYKAKVQLHVSQPVIYVSLDDPKERTEADDSALTVDTRGASSVKDKSHSSATSRYAIIRVQVKRETRVIGALKISLLGKAEQSVDIVETTSEILPGNHWMKLTPKQPLDIDEYALMEVLAPGQINLAVWDFGVSPRDPEAKNAITPVEGVK
ncbi:hypothetical protein ACPOL_4185 [Acidisarcina polymorpha]|uniref:Uncharacterized protein n=1 Tax=Acidisarcina polymorpha TaxID=2211140 RepID=A0A2Z5G2W9_9BACT|nr:hypothetical protein [Acidisarcina polymorpha]AXC13462.1 hypothetical protein ACPOL_4185 [Acidisarcina polymorpha]